VIDPFGGSCVTGEAAELLDRKWMCCELVDEYLAGAIHRFDKQDVEAVQPKTTQKTGMLFDDMKKGNGSHTYYRAYHPAAIWEELEDQPLPEDGGRKRAPRRPNGTK